MTYTFKGSDFIVLEHGQVIKGTNTYDTTTTLSNETEVIVSTATNNFRSKVAVGCGVIVVGATGTSSNFGTTVGFAFIYDYDGTLKYTLTPSDGSNGDGFGKAVGVAHNRVIVSSYDGNSDIYVFTLAGEEVYKLSDVDSYTSDFGFDCDIGCGRIIGGFPDYSTSTGACYITDLHGNRIKRIFRRGYTAGHSKLFGSHVAIGCGRIAVLTGNGYTVPDPDTGMTIFDIDGNYIRHNDTTFSASFNTHSLAIGNGLIVVGAPTIPTGAGSGQVYVYDLNGIELFQLTPNNAPADHGSFGWDVAIGCGRILVSAIDDDADRGAVYVYDLSGNQIQRLVGTNCAAGDRFGYKVSINDGKAAITSSRSGGTTLHVFDTPNIKFHQDLANGR